MSSTLNHEDGKVLITELEGGKRRVSVTLFNQNKHIPHESCETSYPVSMIAEILRIKRPAYLCDEIKRDEDPLDVQRCIKYEVFSYMGEDELDGSRILDFGCGGGASTMILARHLPKSEILGVELRSELLRLALMILCAVYEHLLPHERRLLLPQLWSHLRPGGVLFIFQTPFRWFPLESHTTRMPLINYLPDSITHRLVSRFSNRVGSNETWADLLRRGIRGASPGEILRILREAGSCPVLLEPSRTGLRNRIDLWVSLSGAARYPAFKRIAAIPLRILEAVTGFVFTPYISLAFRKEE